MRVITDVVEKFSEVSSEKPEHELERKIALVLASLEDDKAENIVILDIAKRASFAERMIIASGVSPRQITSMAVHLERRLKEAGFGWVHVEGENGSDWVLMDAGDVIVHLFMPESRGLYALERMWGNELDHSDEDYLVGKPL
ncbi:ribosome silencing factor [Acetobacteraceae bacterium ESL0709]|nr:ribosome silencing factor [Acetobacteraceae bacterium ESL0697]MDF7677202.1 ribosome silencing factor [Acetobacteraceae bacterium ESL0709]